MRRVSESARLDAHHWAEGPKTEALRVGSFGEKLRREREMRKVSLDEMAAATKIGTRSLKALEDEEFKKLPGGIFNKGFVRAYARFLGINEEQAVADYLTAAGEPDNKTADIAPEQLVAQHDSGKKPKSRSRELETINDDVRGFPWLAIAMLVLVIAAAGGGWKYYSRHRAQTEAEEARTQQAAQQTTIQAQPAIALATNPASQEQGPIGTSTKPQDSLATPSKQDASSDQIPPAVPSGSSIGASTNASLEQQTSGQTNSETGFVVSIRAKKEAWVSITVDGKHLMSGNLQPPNEKSIRARSRLMLKTGNAGGVEISFNGKPVPTLGAEGQIGNATFTPEGIQQ